MKDPRTPPSESAIQSEFIRRCDVSGLGELLYAIPNGSKFGRDPRLRAMQANKLAREGRRSGVPDVHLAKARKGYNGLWIEFKAARKYPEPEQFHWLMNLNAEGHLAVWTRDAYAAFILVNAYLTGEADGFARAIGRVGGEDPTKGGAMPEATLPFQLEWILKNRGGDGLATD